MKEIVGDVESAHDYCVARGITSDAELNSLIGIVRAKALATGAQWFASRHGRVLIPTRTQADEAIAEIKAARPPARLAPVTLITGAN